MGQIPYRSPDGQAIGSIPFNADCQHPQAMVEKIGECREGCCTDYHCLRCNQTFRFEWPE